MIAASLIGKKRANAFFIFIILSIYLGKRETAYRLYHLTECAALLKCADLKIS